MQRLEDMVRHCWMVPERAAWHDLYMEATYMPTEGEKIAATLMRMLVPAMTEEGISYCPKRADLLEATLWHFQDDPLVLHILKFMTLLQWLEVQNTIRPATPPLGELSSLGGPLRASFFGEESLWGNFEETLPTGGGCYVYIS